MTTGNRPLNNQSPVNLSVAFQNAGPWLWASSDPAHASFSSGRDVGYVQFGSGQHIFIRGKLIYIVTGFTAERVRGDSINPWTTWATCDNGFGLRRNASAPALRASSSASGDP